MSRISLVGLFRLKLVARTGLFLTVDILRLAFDKKMKTTMDSLKIQREAFVFKCLKKRTMVTRIMMNAVTV